MSAQIIAGDCLAELKKLPDEPVQCCITSPPYYGGLRDYGVEGQLGVESSLADYVQRLVEVFSEVRRTLKSDGSLWLNLGDCFVKKQLQGVPWRVALALQADGWVLRTHCVWNKTNAQPGSQKDRPTVSHEDVFLLTKKARGYQFNLDAMKEKAVGGAARSGRNAFRGQRSLRERSRITTIDDTANGPTRTRRTVWNFAVVPFKGAHLATMPPKLAELMLLASTNPGDCVLDPFSGAGTTGLVALSHERSYLGIELNPNYVKLASERLGLA